MQQAYKQQLDLYWRGEKKKKLFLSDAPTVSIVKICVRPVEVPDQRLGLLSEMSDRK